MNDAEYFADRDYVRFGWLEDFRKSPALYKRKYIDNAIPSNVTDAMQLGSLIHCMLLEPSEVTRRYARAPKVDRRTKEGKQTYAEFVALLDGHTCVDADTWDHAERVCDATRSNPVVARVLESCQRTEHILKWNDTDTPLKCKAKIDCSVHPDNGSPMSLFDIKTTNDPYRLSFERNMANRGYHRQAAWYTWGAELAYGVSDLPFCFIAIGTEEPYDSFVYPVGNQTVAIGREENRATLFEFFACHATGEWEHPERCLWSEINLPKWYQQNTVEAAV